MKLILILLIYFTVNQTVEAQNLKEWFMQQKTQIEYLVSQNAALRVLNSTIRKGYNEKGFGLGLITNDLDAEFVLHAAHYKDYESLPMTEHERLESELELQLESIESLSAGVQRLINRSTIPISLKQGLMQLHTGIRKVLHQKEIQAEILLSDGELEMDDAERLERIREVSRSLTDIERDLQRLVQIHEGILQYSHAEQSAIHQTKTLYP